MTHNIKSTGPASGGVRIETDQNGFKTANGIHTIRSNSSGS